LLMIILIDQDGPLANFELGFLKGWRKRFADEDFVPLSKRRSFYVRDDYPLNLRAKIESVYLEAGFYEDLPIVHGARKAIRTMVGLGCDVWICTSPLSQYENCVLEKYLWVEKHFGREFTKRIIVTKDKTLIKGTYLIDDSPGVEGKAQPEWEHLLFDYPYNRQVNDKPRLNWQTWRELVKI